METETIKQTIRLGNSAAVIVPKKWADKKVRVQLIEKSITEDILEILEKRNLLESVMGIYLIGSYARGDYDVSSDIDVLIITDDVNKLINEKNYEITLISEKNLNSRVRRSLYLSSFIREAKTLLNKSLIKKYRSISFNLPIKKYLGEISSVIKFNEEILKIDKDLDNEKVSDGTIYSLVLRLRELYLLDCLVNKKECSKKDFLKLVNNEKLYKAYIRVKNNIPKKNDSSIEDALEILEKSKKIIERWQKRKK